jgi:heat shock protein HslJ
MHDPNSDAFWGTATFLPTQLTFRGCNSHSVKYTIEGDKFQVTPPWKSTLMACEDSDDAKILSLFESSTMIQILSNGYEVVLRSATGKVNLVLETYLN